MKKYIRASYNNESVRDLYEALLDISNSDDYGLVNGSEYRIIPKYFKDNDEGFDYEPYCVDVNLDIMTSMNLEEMHYTSDKYRFSFYKRKSDGAFVQLGYHPSARPYLEKKGVKFDSINAVIDLLRKLIINAGLTPEF